MSAIVIDDIDKATAEWIDRESKRLGAPTEVVVRRLIRQAIELERKKSQGKIYNDLDSLAGTWDDKEAIEFLQAIDGFEQIDDELWN